MRRRDRSSQAAKWRAASPRMDESHRWTDGVLRRAGSGTRTGESMGRTAVWRDGDPQGTAGGWSGVRGGQPERRPRPQCQLSEP